jgi:hypothetical protein
MFDPIFTPNVRDAHAKSLSIFTEIVATQFTLNEVTIYAYRIGRGCFHVLKLDDQLEITITDGQADIPDKTHCLDYLRTGHIQIGVFDSMDVTYLINHLLKALKEKNEHLTYSYQHHDEQYGEANDQ